MIVNNMGRRDNSAVANAKVEEREKVIHILCGQEVWNLESQIKPSGHSHLRVSTRNAAVLRDVFLYLHVYLVRVRVEIEHDGLFCKPILVMYLGSNFI